MKRIADSREQLLKWSQPAVLRMEYLLSAGNDPVATLKFRSMLGTLAVAESGDGCWTFKRVGFWQGRVTVRTCESDKDMAAFRNNTWDGGGTFEFANGARFHATTGFWVKDLKFTTPAGEPIVSFRFGGVFRRTADVEVHPSGWRTAELPILVLFGWYLAVMMDTDAATTVATTASAL